MDRVALQENSSARKPGNVASTMSVQSESPIEVVVKKPKSSDHDEYVKELRLILQDAHLSFLLGAGTSSDLFGCLANIEDLLTELSKSDGERNRVGRATASVYAKYFETAIAANKSVRDRTTDATDLLDGYTEMLRSINRLLVRRRSSILDKQANVFTTNVDIGVEVAAEGTGIALNDGFTGRFEPAFDMKNFGSVISRRSAHYDNLAEIPTINLLKMHGSVEWIADDQASGHDLEQVIHMDSELKAIDEIAKNLTADVSDALLDVSEATTSDVLLNNDGLEGGQVDSVRDFMEAYEQLQIVNPTKQKFHVTVFDRVYYDLLRVFSNTLEKENSVLLVLGFSCRDEHIRELIKRSAHTNPTLQVFVYAHTDDEVVTLKSFLKEDTAANSNIKVVSPKMLGEGATWTVSSFSTEILDRVGARQLAEDQADAADENLEDLSGTGSAG